jgi:hypothetical protein
MTDKGERGQTMVIVGAFVGVGLLFFVMLIVNAGYVVVVKATLNQAFDAAAASGLTEYTDVPGTEDFPVTRAGDTAQMILGRNLQSLPYVDATQWNGDVSTALSGCDPYDPAMCYDVPFVSIQGSGPVDMLWGDTITFTIHSVAQAAHQPD